MRRRRHIPDNAVVQRVVTFPRELDELGAHLARWSGLVPLLNLQAKAGPIYREDQSNPYNGRAFRGDPASGGVRGAAMQNYTALSVSANPAVSPGFNQVLPGTNPPPGVFNPVLDLLRATQRSAQR